MDTAVCDAPLVVTVVDMDDLPIPNVTVVLSGNGLSRELATDQDGVVRFDQPPASWTFDVPPERRFEPLTIERGSCADLEHVARVTFLPDRLDERHECGQTVDTEGTVRAWSHAQDLLRKLPGTRTLDTVLLLTPGVVPTRTGLHIAGAPPSEVDWYIDGARVTDPVTGGWRPEVVWPMGAWRQPLPGLPPPRR